ncbi:hypothetical protein EIP86_002297 [Pleurotus ostreatoroseus]|nr:hypothetical protein EIP86_002297 [Pleurotus ostreatoroseus]
MPRGAQWRLWLFLLFGALWTARGADFPVTVGGPGVLQFTPSTITGANPGDTVTFTFKQSNHTATQSTFYSPCQMAPDGFDTGFIPVPDNNTDGPFPTIQYTVQDTNPVWVYCRQLDHCLQGMVFAINPGNQFPAFLSAAAGGTLLDTHSSTSGPSSPSPSPYTVNQTSAISTSPSSSIPTEEASVTVTAASSGLPLIVNSTSSAGTVIPSNTASNASLRSAACDAATLILALMVTIVGSWRS